MTTRKFLDRFAKARKLKQNSEGVALIEFAFSLPILLALIFGGLETANYALAHLRVSQIAMTVADNAGRVDTTIDEANIQEVFAGAALVGNSIDFTQNGRVVLSSLQPNNQSGSDEGQMINWQRCMGQLTTATPAYGVEDDGRTDDSLELGMGPAGNKITSADGTAVMFVEVTYDYQPLLPTFGILGTRQIRYESAFTVRDRTNQDISNTQSLTVASC
ncbi:pilus assembly protein [Parasphingopyxis algicola]|uniref:TadE/TadG family type IV pilus assembly protein n=1 Tax=Parasphingopyxis algicola TaxID=2026624 RepID=UPI0015A0FF2C|nr:TadE/TadG family type IV pilus assembly protein [Parasphingopyxis algicola]QLC24206.1 pilus assembly protein [Parasphingopyxis algicola]